MKKLTLQFFLPKRYEVRFTYPWHAMVNIRRREEEESRMQFSLFYPVREAMRSLSQYFSFPFLQCKETTSIRQGQWP